jgi:hypothetical protein
MLGKGVFGSVMMDVTGCVPTEPAPFQCDGIESEQRKQMFKKRFCSIQGHKSTGVRFVDGPELSPRLAIFGK